jgi:hypothetical protein
MRVTPSDCVQTRASICKCASVSTFKKWRSIQAAPNHTEYTLFGYSTSLASRLQSLATPGSTMIIGPTSGFADGYFHLKVPGTDEALRA